MPRSTVAHTSATHTPGPWVTKIDSTATADYIQSVVTKKTVVAAVHSYRDGRIDRETRAANARLMAAAPDMLQALREVAGDCYVAMITDDNVGRIGCRYCGNGPDASHEEDCTMQFCSCGRRFNTIRALMRHQMYTPHCADCGVQLTAEEISDGAGVCMACEHLRECPGCPASAHGFARAEGR